MITESQIKQRHPNGDYTFEVVCAFCHKPTQITVSGREMFELQTSGKLIQNILPNHTPEEREMLISHMCANCWNDTFDNYDDEDDEDDEL